MKLVVPPITITQFMGQDYSDEEYLRKYVTVDGHRYYYSTVDAKGYRGHCAYDVNDIYSDRRLFAMFDGIVHHRNDRYLGLVSILEDPHTREGVWYCHQSYRTVGNGVKVTAKQQIGVMGATGNAGGVHCHMPAMHQWNDYGSIWNWGPLLRELQQSLLVPIGEDNMPSMLYQKKDTKSIFLLNGDYLTQMSKLIFDSGRLSNDMVTVLPETNAIWGLPVLQASEIKNP